MLRKQTARSCNQRPDGSIHFDECGTTFGYEKGVNPAKCPNCGALHIVMN